MTSEVNDAQTRAFFQQHAFFSLPHDRVVWIVFSKDSDVPFELVDIAIH